MINCYLHQSRIGLQLLHQQQLETYNMFTIINRYTGKSCIVPVVRETSHNVWVLVPASFLGYDEQMRFNKRTRNNDKFLLVNGKQLLTHVHQRFIVCIINSYYISWLAVQAAQGNYPLQVSECGQVKHLLNKNHNLQLTIKDSVSQLSQAWVSRRALNTKCGWFLQIVHKCRQGQ